MRVALIGSSHVHTPDYLAVCRALPWVDLVGVAEPDPETRGLLPDLPPSFARADDLPPHDLTVVLTDAASHPAVCADLNAPTLFVEKPLATGGAGARTLAQALEGSGKRVETGFFLRYSKALATLRGAVDGGPAASRPMGAVRFARLAFAHPGLKEGWLRRWPAHMAPERMGGGAFADLAIHLVDAVRAIAGPIEAVACRLDRPSGEHAGLDVQGQAMLTTKGDAPVHVWASAVAPRVMLSIAIVCERGEARLDGGRVTRRVGDGPAEVLHDGPMPTPSDGFRAALLALHGDRPPITTLADAVAASRLMDELRMVCS